MSGYDVEYVKKWSNTIDCGICHKEVFDDERHPIKSDFGKPQGWVTWPSYLHGDCVAQRTVGGKPNLIALHMESNTYIARQLKKLPKLERKVAAIKQLSLFEGSEA